MDQQGIEVANLPLLPVIGRERKMISVGLVEGRLEAAKESGHGQVHAPMAEVDGRIDQHRPAALIAEKVT